MMTPDSKNTLKARAHHLKPIILVGQKGLTEAVINETRVALLTHELLKIKMSGAEKEDRRAMIQHLCDALEADLIQTIGSMVVIYKKNPDKAINL